MSGTVQVQLRPWRGPAPDRYVVKVGKRLIGAFPIFLKAEEGKGLVGGAGEVAPARSARTSPVARTVVSRSTHGAWARGGQSA